MRFVAAFAFLALAPLASAADLVEISPITDHILLLHFKEGYVVHHQRGHPRSDEKVVIDPLDVAAASAPANYNLNGQHPVSIGRKSKGMDFAWFADKWVNGHAENDRPDHTKEHWIYLTFSAPLKTGVNDLTTGTLAKNGPRWLFNFDPRTTISESIHVNLLGYAPAAPAKFGYVYQWAGDKGSIDFSRYAGKRFWLLEEKTYRRVFEGSVRFRKTFDNPETLQTADTPHGNFLNADVYECDFSTFRKPGRYFLSVEGLGCSVRFSVSPDVYRQAFHTVAKGLFHNRSGIALTKPYTEFERPAPHNPRLTPGFKGMLRYSTLRYLDYGSESGTKEQIEPTIKGPLDAWGWYQDAGDWDSYASHIRVPQELMLAYELNPGAFADGELSIPENKNGVPDILDEAAWLPRFCHRLRHELLDKKYGTGGLGLRVDGDAFGGDTKAGDLGQGSWEDVNRIYVASGEDPVSTYGYAGAAAQLAYCLQVAHKPDPQKVDWLREARESYAWARAHTLPKDEKEVKVYRLYASAALFRLTGDKAYERQIAADFTPDFELWMDRIHGAAIYALGGAHDLDRDNTLLEKVRAAILKTADESDQSAQRRALRWGGNWGLPMLIGQQTTPLVMEIAVARELVRKTDPAKARRYEADLYTSCDYFLGTNALNQTWVTGLGIRHPRDVFHMDSWYSGKPGPHPGVIPYGPWRKSKDVGQGPWDSDWANKTVYPPIDQWPGNERWFENRCAPLTSEFTVHQNLAPAMAIFGILCAAKRR